MQLQRRDDFEPAPRTILWLMPGHQPTLPLACHGSVGDHTTSRPDRQTLQCLVFGNRSDRSHLPTRQDLWSGALNQEGVNAHEIPQNQLLEFRFRVRSVSQFPVTRLYGQVKVPAENRCFVRVRCAPVGMASQRPSGDSKAVPPPFRVT
jgi:hypothetical protein